MAAPDSSSDVQPPAASAAAATAADAAAEQRARCQRLEQQAAFAAAHRAPLAQFGASLDRAVREQQAGDEQGPAADCSSCLQLGEEGLECGSEAPPRSPEAAGCSTREQEPGPSIPTAAGQGGGPQLAALQAAAAEAHAARERAERALEEAQRSWQARESQLLARYGALEAAARHAVGLLESRVAYLEAHTARPGDSSKDSSTRLLQHATRPGGSTGSSGSASRRQEQAAGPGGSSSAATARAGRSVALKSPLDEAPRTRLAVRPRPAHSLAPTGAAAACRTPRSPRLGSLVTGKLPAPATRWPGLGAGGLGRCAAAPGGTTAAPAAGLGEGAAAAPPPAAAPAAPATTSAGAAPAAGAGLMSAIPADERSTEVELSAQPGSPRAASGVGAVGGITIRRLDGAMPLVCTGGEAINGVGDVGA